MALNKEKFSLSPKQRWSIRHSDKRLNFWHGSVRSGKTVGSEIRFLKYAAECPPGDLFLVGKTIDSLKRNVINPLLEYIGTEGNYFPGRRELVLWDRIIHTVGASDERSEGKIRGSTVAGAYGDELTLWPESFFRMLLSRMSVPGAKFFGTTNPDNPNHWLKKQFLDRKVDIGNMSSFHFSIEDNPYLDPEYVAALKKEYVGLWYKRFILGQWCVAEGAIYDFFDEKKHVSDVLPEADYFDVSADYGTTNPTAFIVFGISLTSKPKIWAENEYYYDPVEKKRQKTDLEFAEDFVKFIKPYGHRIRNIFCDPSAESFQLQLARTLQQHGVYRTIKDGDNEVLDGIRVVSTMLSNGDYMIHPRCRRLCDEKYSYVWDPKAQDKGVDLPLKKNDHLCDAERYEINSLFGAGNTYDLSKFVN